MKKKGRWYDFYVVEAVEKVVGILKDNELEVEYKVKKVLRREHAIGHIEEGLGGMVLNCAVFRRDMRFKAQSCIEVPSSYKNFDKLVQVIKNALEVVAVK